MTLHRNLVTLASLLTLTAFGCHPKAQREEPDPQATASPEAPATATNTENDQMHETREPTPEEAKESPIPAYKAIVENATVASKLPCPDGCDLQVLPDALVCRATGKKQGWVSSARQGPAIYFHKNGKKKSEGSYSNNESEGVWWEWDEAGNLARYAEYKHGQPDGLSVELYPDGKRKTEHRMKAGKFEGTSKRWSPTGKLEAITEWSGDQTVKTIMFPQNMPGPASATELKAMEDSLHQALEEQKKLLNTK